MLITIALVIAFGLIGLPLTTGGVSGRVLLAPVFGLSASVLIAYVISLNFHVIGADAMAVAVAMLVFIYIAKIGFIRKTVGADYADLRRDGRTILLALAPAIFLLIPAMQHGIGNFFGAVNFDFFYNSQDAWFLAKNTVADFNPGITNEILPLDWSANAQGRFAAALLGSFFLKFFSFDTLHFHSYLISSLVIICSFAAYVFSRRVLGLGFWFSGLATAAFIISGSFAQGYTYYLLGQISAIPIFIVVLILYKNLLEEIYNNTKSKKNTLHQIAAISFLLNALFVFYAIFLVFCVAIIALSLAFVLIKSRINRIKFIYFSMHILVSSSTLFVLTRILSLNETKKSILDWVILSVKTANPNEQAPAVFSEYTTESFLTLILGVFRYPTNASLFNDFLGSGVFRSWLLILIGVFSLIIFAFCFAIFLKKKNSSSANSVVLALAIIFISSALLFFVSQSGYALFKVSSWFMPILLMVPVAAIAHSNTLSRRYRVSLIASVIFLLSVNSLTAINYAYAFLEISGFEKHENSLNVNGLKGIDGLKSWLETYTDRPLIFDLSDGIKTAWVANEFRDRSVSALSHNFQPLDDRILPNPPCSFTPEKFPSDGILVSDRAWNARNEILSMYPTYQPVFSNDSYAAYLTSDLNHYAFLGRGAYSTYTLSEEQALKTGLPATFRWVEKGLEIFVYTVDSTKIDIQFDVAPGYVNSMPIRSVDFSGDKIHLKAEFQKNKNRVHFDSIPVTKGMNCFFIDSKDDVTSLPRYGALFRENVLMDFRFLNFAVGNMQIQFK